MGDDKDRLTERQVWWISRGTGWVVGIAIVVAISHFVGLY